MNKIDDKKHNKKSSERVKKYKGSINVCNVGMADYSMVPLSEGMKNRFIKSLLGKLRLGKNEENSIEQGEKDSNGR